MKGAVSAVAAWGIGSVSGDGNPEKNIPDDIWP
jgi:hypothetical protein